MSIKKHKETKHIVLERSRTKIILRTIKNISIRRWCNFVIAF